MRIHRHITGLLADGPGQVVLRLCQLLLAMGRARVVGAVALNVAAGLLEGVGVLALPSLLTVMGVGGGGVSPDDGFLLMAVTGYVLLVLVAAMVVWVRSFSAQRLTLDFLDTLRGDLHAAILRMEWARFRGLQMAGLLQTATVEIPAIAHAVTLLGVLASVVFSIPFVLGASLLLSWQLTLAAVAVAGFTVVVTRRLGHEGFRLGRELSAVNRAVHADLNDNLAGLRIIKSFGAETLRVAGITARFSTARRNLLDYHRIQANERAVLQVGAAAAAAIALYLAISVLRMPVADALVLILAYGRLLQTALRGLSTWRQLTRAVAALASYDQALALCRDAAEPAPPPAHSLPVVRDAIRLQGVSVHYGSGQFQQVGLDDIHAVLPVGKITALIGASGSGKSTLADLLSGLTTPDQGDIFLDNTVLSSQLRQEWRSRVAVVPQDPFLFHDTIAVNLRLARPDADEPALWRALEAAAIADFVRALPQGLETVVGDRGGRLSGGERQRIVLARALLREPEFLVLDEATASLDGETEALVARTLTEMKGRCTVLVVAHRPSTVSAADHLLVLEAGRLIAAGSWEDVRRQVGPRLAALGIVAAG